MGSAEFQSGGSGAEHRLNEELNVNMNWNWNLFLVLFTFFVDVSASSGLQSSSLTIA